MFSKLIRRTGRSSVSFFTTRDGCLEATRNCGRRSFRLSASHNVVRSRDLEAAVFPAVSSSAHILLFAYQYKYKYKCSYPSHQSGIDQHTY